MNLQLLLPILGGLFVIVTMSVVVQVVSYRVFHRRLFLMAPLHHHFELKGWPETTVIVRFWILAGVFAALGTRPLLYRLPVGHRALRRAREIRVGTWRVLQGHHLVRARRSGGTGPDRVPPQ